jgi:hypothetical protein
MRHFELVCTAGTADQAILNGNHVKPLKAATRLFREPPNAEGTRKAVINPVC